jgi:hypothetical protein
MPTFGIFAMHRRVFTMLPRFCVNKWNTDNGSPMSSHFHNFNFSVVDLESKPIWAFGVSWLAGILLHTKRQPALVVLAASKYATYEAYSTSTTHAKKNHSDLCQDLDPIHKRQSSARLSKSRRLKYRSLQVQLQGRFSWSIDHQDSRTPSDSAPGDPSVIGPDGCETSSVIMSPLPLCLARCQPRGCAFSR